MPDKALEKKKIAAQCSIAYIYHNGFKYTLKCIQKTTTCTERNSNSSYPLTNMPKMGTKAGQHILSEAVSVKYLASTHDFLNELNTTVKAIILLLLKQNELVKISLQQL